MIKPSCAVGLAAAFVVLVPLGVLAESIDPNDDGSQYAFAENVGWFNAEPLGDGGPGVQVTDDALAGWMWGENIGWVSVSCQNTSSCATTAYGVVNDGNGVLSGYAWSENEGWISFACENTASCGTADYGVEIDPLNGDFSGRAWGENTGWVTFASSGANPYKVTANWCNPPALSLVLSVAKAGADAQLTWISPVTSNSFDAVQGDLNALRAGGGDWVGSTAACIAENGAPPTSFVGTPSPGEAFWFLVRGDCGGGYDSGGPGQVDLRDAGIAASGNDCM